MKFVGSFLLYLLILNSMEHNLQSFVLIDNALIKNNDDH